MSRIINVDFTVPDGVSDDDLRFELQDFIDKRNGSVDTTNFAQKINDVVLNFNDEEYAGRYSQRAVEMSAVEKYSEKLKEEIAGVSDIDLEPWQRYTSTEQKRIYKIRIAEKRLLEKGDLDL